MKPTHRVVSSPTIPIQYLADYMAASDQARRGIAQKCKYKSLARTFQHQLARKTISDHIIDGNPLPGNLSEKAQGIRELLTADEFEEKINQHNADFVDSFAANFSHATFAGFEIMAAMQIQQPTYNGTLVRFVPSLLTYRMTKANTQKIGAVMFRYAKGKPVSERVAWFQAAFMFGLFSENPFMEEAKPEGKLCRVMCAVSGNVFTAPTTSIYKFNEMKAVCGDLAERWPNIPAPPNSVIA